MEKKKCTKCGEVKNVDEFYKCKNGLRSACKICADKKNKLYVENNKEKVVEYRKQYYINNKERIIKRDKEYYENNKEKIDARKKKYHEDNKVRLNLKSKQYYKDNNEKLKQYGKQYTIHNKHKIGLKKKKYYNTNKKMICLNGKKYYKENKQKLLECNKNYYNSNAKYDLFVDKLTVDELPKSHNDGVSLEVKCRYCGKYFIPVYEAVKHRIVSLNGNGGDSFLYCSENCKQACPVYGQIKYPKGVKKASSREVNSLVRQMCFERDNWECQVCGKSINEVQLHCHHIEGYAQNPILGNDIDNVVTLCKTCHKEIHKLPGCNYHELRCDEKD